MSEKDKTYWQALGKFIETYAMVEYQIFSFLEYYGRIPPQTARAVLSGARTDVCVQYIRKLHQIVQPGDEIRDEIESSLSQLKIISNVRNLILHHGTNINQAGERTASNKTRKIYFSKHDEVRVSAKTLKAMTDDCIKIANHLATLRLKPDLALAGREKLAPVLKRAWRYKSDEDPPRKDPSTQANRRRRDKQSLESRPKASPA